MAYKGLSAWPVGQVEIEEVMATVTVRMVCSRAAFLPPCGVAAYEARLSDIALAFRRLLGFLGFLGLLGRKPMSSLTSSSGCEICRDACRG